MKQRNRSYTADILLRTYHNARHDNIGLIAAGIAFYFFLAIFPALAMMVSLYGLIADPAVITEQIRTFSGFLPDDVVRIVLEQAVKIAGSSGSVLGMGVVISLVLTLFAASKGVKGLIMGLNIAYGEHETRNILKQNLLAMVLTLFVMVVTLLALSFVAVLPFLFYLIHLGEIGDTLMLLRWPLLFFAGLTMLDFIYCYAPDRGNACWRWMNWGSFVAAVLWVGVSAVFSWYVSSFGNYNEVYGTLGAVIVLLIWLWLSAGTILLGAEINAAVAHRAITNRSISDFAPLFF